MHGLTSFLIGLALVFLISAAGLWFFRRIRVRRRAAAGPVAVRLVTSTLDTRGIRYAQSSGEPVVLVHGYAGNLHNWRELGRELARRGLDVWILNLRGHGGGEERSEPIAAGALGERRYGFREIVGDDLPTMVEEVYRARNRKLVLVGHSLGGIAAKALLHGFCADPSQGLRADPVRAEHFARHRIRASVMIGSPTHFEHLPSLLRWFSGTLPRLATLAQTILPVHRLADRVSAEVLEHPIFRGVIHAPNFPADTDELSHLLAHGVSKVHPDLVRDVTLWASRGTIVDSEGGHYAFDGRVSVPMLLVAGELDGLARPEHVLEEAERFSRSTVVRTIVLRSTSHADLIAGSRASRLLAPQIERFVRSPASLERHQVLG